MITELTVNEESIRQTIDEAADGLPIETGPYKEKSLKVFNQTWIMKK